MYLDQPNLSFNPLIFFESLINENYRYCTNQLAHTILMENATRIETSSNPNETSSMLDDILKTFKQNPAKFTRLTLNNLIAGLNRLAAFVQVKEETESGERSLWSKIKSKIAHMIVVITDWLGKKFMPKDEDKLKDLDYTSTKSSSDVDKLSTRMAYNREMDKMHHPQHEKRYRIIRLAALRGILDPEKDDKYTKYRLERG